MRTLHTYVSQKSACERAVTYLSRRSVLANFETIKRGHHKFTLYAPTPSNETQCRNALDRALESVDREPPVWTEVVNEPLIDDAHVDMREVIKEQSGLAFFYAEDGAYHSAARVLQELADRIKVHAQANTDAMVKG